METVYKEGRESGPSCFIFSIFVTISSINSLNFIICLSSSKSAYYSIPSTLLYLDHLSSTRHHSRSKMVGLKQLFLLGIPVYGYAMPQVGGDPFQR